MSTSRVLPRPGCSRCSSHIRPPQVCPLPRPRPAKLSQPHARVQHVRAIASTSRQLAKAAAERSITRENSHVDSAGLPVSYDLLDTYRGYVATGRLKWDEEQVRCVMRLRHLLEELTDYAPPIELLARLPDFPLTRSKAWWKGKSADMSSAAGQTEEERAIVRILSGEEELAALTTPKGILLTGPPGTGKSLLLSMLFDALPTPHKKRWHYHAFTLWLYRQVFVEMQRRREGLNAEVHGKRMDLAARRGWKAVFAGGRWENEGEGEGQVQEETIPFAIARSMIMEYHILYFDELQLLDASAAALLRDVLSWYWRLGGVVVSCSNRVPDDLYHHGVQKERMAGFLDALKTRCEVYELDGGRDWRTLGEAGVSPSWFNLTERSFDDAWEAIVGQGHAEPAELSVYSRRLRVPLSTPTACRFTFEDLCEATLGPADYITLSARYPAIFIDEVPSLPLKKKNEARRFINLVDALYEARCQVFVRASAPPEELFFPDALDPSPASMSGKPDTSDPLTAESLSETLHAPYRPNISVYNPLSSTQREKMVKEAEKRATSFSVLSIFTGEDERFAYARLSRFEKRAVSRLVEMTRSPAYRKEAWLPLTPEGRTWEAFVPPPSLAAGTSASPSNRLAGRPGEAGLQQTHDDFAVEAGYSRPAHMGEGGPREDAPVIRSQHVWGVEDTWGPKAGRWGKGASAFQGQGRDPSSDDSKR